MGKETRQDNPLIRAFSYKFVPEKLNSNPLFVKLFGEDFAEKRSKSNVLAVYTNEKVGIKMAAGYQTMEDKSVTLCESSKNGALLTPKDIMKNADLQEILVHEFIHAIFTRTKQECEEFDILWRNWTFICIL
ncbi:MAG: hypothetical protein IKF38_03805 [Clostridia bacterium]|nr:hypothetical protein [Clostridia bacterium]